MAEDFLYLVPHQRRAGDDRLAEDVIQSLSARSFEFKTTATRRASTISNNRQLLNVILTVNKFYVRRPYIGYRR